MTGQTLVAKNPAVAAGVFVVFSASAFDMAFFLVGIAGLRAEFRQQAATVSNRSMHSRFQKNSQQGKSNANENNKQQPANRRACHHYSNTQI